MSTLTTGSFERVGARRRPDFSVEPSVMTWDTVAFAVHGRREAVVCVPRRELDAFVDALDAGALDAAITAYLSSPPAGRVVRASKQTASTRLFDRLASSDAIAPDERTPRRAGGFGRGAGPAEARRDKGRRRPPRRALVGAAIVATVVVGGTIAVAATRGGGSSTTATRAGSTPTSTANSTPASSPSTTPTTTAGTTVDLAALQGTYGVEQIYSGCGSLDQDVHGNIPVSVDFATGIITIGVSKATGPLVGTKFAAPTTYQKPGGGSTTVDLTGFFDLTGATPVLHAEASPDLVNNGTCHVTYDGPKNG